MTLLPCRACGRHVKSEECQCPFCGAARSCDEKAPRVEPAGQRLKAIAVSAALGIGAPDDSPADAAADSPASPPSPQPIYGAVGTPVDASVPKDGGSERR
jgi:hypothetical protein